MNISYSQYKAFLDNPERYRMFYVLGLTPEGAETPSNFNLGKRRGRCFHDLSEGKKSRARLVQEYGAELVVRCELIREAVPDLGPLECVEQSFKLPILDGKHNVIGRVDHIFMVDGHRRVGDYKSTKGTRTKKETQDYLATLETSAQSHFYLYAAAQLGYPTDLFTYHVIFDRKNKESKPQYFPLDIQAGPATVARTIAGVYAACEAIQFLWQVYGPEKPWPHGNAWPCCGDKFFCGYGEICGRTIPKGAIPPGFTERWKDKIQTEGE